MAYESESLKLDLSAPNNTAGSANPLNPGEWMEGALSSAGDVDYYQLTAQAGLLMLDFRSVLVSSTARWKVELLNASGDLLRTLSTSATGSSPTVKADASLSADKLAVNRQVTVSGLSSTLSIGSQFTLVTPGADTQVYTIVSVDGRSGNDYTVTLDRIYTSTTAASIAFDPAFLSSTGALGQVAALLPADGVYYLKVSALGWTDADYALRAAVLPSAEVQDNDDVYDARGDNSRLVPNLQHTGALSTATDTDVWLLTTAQASSFSINFSGSTKTSFHVTVQTWNSSGALETARALGGVLLDSQVQGSKSFAIDTAVYGSGTTFVVTVKVDSAANLDSAAGGGNYTLKATGASLDANDTPVIQMAGFSSGLPDSYDANVTAAIVRSYKQGAATKVALANLFSASDADVGQTLSYKVWYVTAVDDKPAATGSIQVEAAGQTARSYDYGTVMSATDLASAFLYTGSSVGTYVLRMQAIDSSGAQDYSGHSGFMGQTIRVLDSAKAVQVSADALLSLVEGATEGEGYSETLTIGLTEAPSAGKTVTVNLVDAGNQFLLSASSLTFTSTATQTVTVRARSDDKVEPTQSGLLSFTVVSSDPDYNGLSVTDPYGQLLGSLRFSLADPDNAKPGGGVSLSWADTSKPLAQGDTLVATHTLTDANGLGNLNYAWQRSADGQVWSDIAGANAASYKTVSADAGKVLRVHVSYVDGLGKLEEVNSDATSRVGRTSEPPTTADLSLPLARGETYTFRPADFPFTDGDAGDTLGFVLVYSLPAGGQLKLGDLSVTPGSRVAANEISNLVYTPPEGLGRQNLSLGFAVGDSRDELSGAGTLTLQLDNRPTGQSKALSAPEDTPVVLSVSDFGYADSDGDAMQSLLITTLPDTGELKLRDLSLRVGDSVQVSDVQAGLLRYLPALNVNGLVSLGFKVGDGLLSAASASQLGITLTPVNDAPVAVAASIVAGVGAAKSGVLPGTDVDGDVLTFSKVANPSHGTVVIAANGAYTYTPVANYLGSDSFSFKVNDGSLDSAVATVTIAVRNLGFDIRSSVKTWKGVAMANVAVEEGGQRGASDAQGGLSLAGVADGDGENDGLMTLNPAKTAPGSTAAASISLNDVLGALKVYLGKPLPSAYDTPFKFIAADFDGNGSVTLPDVLGLLKFYLNKPATSAPAWVFVDAADVSTSNGVVTGILQQGSTTALIDKEHTLPHAIDHNFTADPNVDFIGVLRGDVDGSWTGV